MRTQKTLRVLFMAAIVAVASAMPLGATARASGTAAIAFAAMTSSATGVDPAGVAVADFNDDGRLDVAVADLGDPASIVDTPDFGCVTTWGPGIVTVLLGSGDGTFGNRVDVAVGSQPIDVASADLNHDGNADLVVVDSAGVDVVLGNGDGTFQPARTFPLDGAASHVAVADVNRDGNPDVVADGQASGTGGVAVLYGTGDGTFAAAIPLATTTTAAPATGVAVGDLNGDGLPDIAAGGGNGVSIIHSSSEGGFDSYSSYPTGSQVTSVAVGDLNGDGRTDIILASDDANTVSVLLGNDSGGYAPPASYATPVFPWSLAVADVNGDGAADVVVGSRGGLAVLLGNGSGSLAPETPIGPNVGAFGAAVGDFNGDGRVDIASAAFGPGDGEITSSDGQCGQLVDANGSLSVLVNTGVSSSDGTSESGGAGSDSDLNAQILPSLTVSLDKTSLDFGSLLPHASVGRTATATVGSNDGAGYQLGVSRTPFTPRDLPATIACSACGLAGTAIPTSGLLPVVSTTQTSSDSGDSWPTTVTVGPIPLSAPAGSYHATLTYTVVGL